MAGMGQYQVKLIQVKINFDLLLGLRGKRSADADPHYYGYYGHPFAYHGYGYHGLGATSYVGRTVWGAGK